MDTDFDAVGLLLVYYIWKGAREEGRYFGAAKRGPLLDFTRKESKFLLLDNTNNMIYGFVVFKSVYHLIRIIK